jgi:tetratricopeptide (TPR) repeat protein
MKNIIVYLFLIVTQLIAAQSRFEKGNALYQKGDYQGAAQQYENIITEDKQHSYELYFNLGNCYYKLNKVAPAIYNYEKALVLRPNDADILNNLKFAKKLTIDEIKEVPRVGFAKLLHNFTSVFHYNTWAWISVGVAFTVLLMFIGYYFSQLAVYKRIYFILMFVFLVVLVITISAGISEKDQYKNDRPAIVFAEVAEVYSEPQKAGPATLILHEGAKVYVFETLKNWKKIELTDGTEGWIEASAVREVK